MTSPPVRQRWIDVKNCEVREMLRLRDDDDDDDDDGQVLRQGGVVDAVPLTMEVPGFRAVEVAAVAILALGRAALDVSWAALK
jgi:hypothetical protein